MKVSVNTGATEIFNNYVMGNDIPVLVPIELEAFYEKIRLMIRQELISNNKTSPKAKNLFDTPGLVNKSLYSMKSIRQLFDDTSWTTIYEWINAGKLKPRKLKGKVYFFWRDIEQALMESE
jgi:hypothetical protein